MSKVGISIPEAPEFESGYSHAIKAGNTVYVGGTTGLDMTTGKSLVRQFVNRPAKRCSTARQSSVLLEQS